MSEPNNIDLFNRLTLALLLRLYEKFPRPTKLNVLDLVEILKHGEANEYIDAVVTAKETIAWLAEEGFLRYERVDRDDVFHKVRLSMRGLAILNGTPKALRERKPFIDRVRSAAAKGAEKAAADVVKEIMASVVQLGVAYANAP